MKRAFIAALLIIAAIPMIIAMMAMPRFGDGTGPVHTHVSARFLESGAQEAGAENIVTGVLLNYRGLDTAGEVTVIFTALMAGLAVLLLPNGETGTSGPRRPTPHPVSPVVRFVVRLLAPFIALFSVYVILNGHVTPGGGFQGGAMLAALFIALSVVLEGESIRPRIPTSLRPWLQGAALLTFVAVGFAGLALTGSFLGFPAQDSMRQVGSTMIVLLEIGIALGGAAVFSTLFVCMRAD